MRTLLITCLLLLVVTSIGVSQQSPDTSFVPKIDKPTYSNNNGPAICIDSAHNNLHRLNSGFAPFARLMKADGFKLRDMNNPVKDRSILSDCDIYAIINPLHESNLGNWRLPTPSAFSETEIREIEAWVKEGGRLFLIADHMPFAGAANSLASVFGFNFSNGFANLAKEGNQPDYFSIDNGRLLKNDFFPDEINSVTSFTGSAFTYPDEAEVVMKFKGEDISLEPEIAWQFNDSTKSVNLGNYAQGALLNYEQGKVAIFGEAAMFTAQTVTTQNGTFKVGFNSRIATNNQLFAVRLMEYLVE
jgi:hypothetical protein